MGLNGMGAVLVHVDPGLRLRSTSRYRKCSISRTVTNGWLPEKLFERGGKSTGTAISQIDRHIFHARPLTQPRQGFEHADVLPPRHKAKTRRFAELPRERAPADIRQPCHFVDRYRLCWRVEHT